MWPNYTLTLSSPVPPGVGVFSVANSAQQYEGSLEVTDRVFRANRARGVLLKQSNVLCARNLFNSMTASAVITNIDACYWMEGQPVSNWSFVDNVVHEVNVWGGLADVAIDNSVPVFAKGVPTTQCVPYALVTPGVAVQRGLNISGNSFSQVSGMSAVGVYSTDGLERGCYYAQGGHTTRRTRPAVDLDGFGVVNAAGNVCDGQACAAEGMGA